MKKRRINISWILMAAICLSCLPLNSCGCMHSYWGVESDYDFHDHHHKHKKPKPPKWHGHKKHHHHHHDDD